MGEDTNFSLILTLTSIKRECITYVQIIGKDVLVVFDDWATTNKWVLTKSIQSSPAALATNSFC